MLFGGGSKSLGGTAPLFRSRRAYWPVKRIGPYGWHHVPATPTPTPIWLVDAARTPGIICHPVMPLVSDEAFESTTYNVKVPPSTTGLVYNIPREMFVHAPSPYINGTVLSRVDISMSSFANTQAAQRLEVARSLVNDYGANYITERLMFVKLNSKPQNITAFLPVRILDEETNPCVQALQSGNGVALFGFPKQELIRLFEESGAFPGFARAADRWTIQNVPYTRESVLAWNKIYPKIKRKRERVPPWTKVRRWFRLRSIARFWEQAAAESSGMPGLGRIALESLAAFRAESISA